MAIYGRYRGDITSQGMEGTDQFGLRWNRILFPNTLPAAHFGAAPPGDSAPVPFGHGALTYATPIDADSALVLDFSAISQNPGSQNAGPQPEAPGPVVAAAPDLVSHPPYFAPAPLHDLATDPAQVPADAAPPGGFIPKSGALIWSGPAIVAFPADSHDATSDSVPPVLASAPDSPGASGPPTPPDVAGAPDAITRADLDPVLAAMGSGPDHAPPAGDAGGDLASAFHPSDGGGAHGLDPGFAFTPQPPLPPPPDVIG